MSALRYTPLQLQRLPADALRRIIIEQGWRPLPSTADSDELSTYILNLQDGKTRDQILPQFSNGVVMGPIAEVAGQLEDFYEQKAAVTTQLLSLSDAALFAVVDRLGHELKLSPPYVQVGGLQMADRYALVWHLISMLNQ